MSDSTNKIGAGRSVVNRHERAFKRGSLMFIEGETSTEMFIIRNGSVRILKQEGEATIELATLGPGSVLGELSLLDHQPRGATAQVTEDTSVTVIDEELLNGTLEKVPDWMRSIIQVVVKRLRDTMKRTSDDVVRKSVSGSIKVLILLLVEAEKKEDMHVISLKRAKEAIYSVIGLSGLEAENVFLHLIIKEMIYIRKNDSGIEFVYMKDPDILLLYMNFLRARQRGTPMMGESFSDAAFSLLSCIAETGQKNGKQIQKGFVRVGIPQVEIEQQRKNAGIHIDPNVLDELIASKIILQEEAGVEPGAASRSRKMLIYNVDTVKRIMLLQQWLPTFKEEVTIH